MRIILTLAFGFLICIQTVSAQSAIINRNQINRVQHQEARLGIGESLTISPIPLPKSNAVLTINAVNVDIFSYRLFTAAGQIVELENLSGRPDISVLDLNGIVDLGTYILQFETDSGILFRKFLVI